MFAEAKNQIKKESYYNTSFAVSQLVSMINNHRLVFIILTKILPVTKTNSN